MKIETEEQLAELLGQPNPVLHKKIYDHLNPRMVNFVEHSPLVFISTVDSEGFPTISPKGDSPGFVQVDDESTLLIPERKGNKLAFTFKNILAGSKVAILFIVPGTFEVLRVQGHAELEADPSLNRRLASSTHDALLVMRLVVNHAYFHCGKALLRSRAFSEDAVFKRLVISFGQELAENQGLKPSESEEFDSGVQSRYKTDL